MLLGFLICACSSNEETKINIKYNRFEKVLFSLNKNNVDSVMIELDKNFGTFNEIFESQIMQRGNMHDSIYIKELLLFVNHSDMKEAYDSTLVMYSDISFLQQDLNNAFSLFDDYFPTYPIPSITTFFGGFNYGVVTYDNNIAIGLENFLGYNCKFYRFLRNPEYLRFQKQKKFIVSNIMEVWFDEHFQQYLINRDFLSQMIYKGKMMLFLEKMLPDMSLQDKFRFSDTQMDWVIKNELSIWSYFIEEDVLYSTNESDFRTFLNYGPFARGMPKEAPARVAYYIGYKIIKEYINNNKIDLEDLMYLTDSRQLLRESKYKPRK